MLALLIAALMVPGQAVLWNWFLFGQPVASGSPSLPPPGPSPTAPVPIPTPAATPVPVPTPGTGPPASTALRYWGGPVMGGGAVTVYVIFWQPPGYHFETDDASDARYESILLSFFRDVSSSPWISTLRQYSYEGGRPVVAGPITGEVRLGGAFRYTAPFPEKGTVADPLQDYDIAETVIQATRATGWPASPNSVFLVATPRDIQSCAGDSCSFGAPGQAYCGYHSDLTIGSSGVVSAYVNLPDVGCIPDMSPNHDDAADYAVVASAHELAESITDPQAENSGWSGSKGEVGDYCELDDQHGVSLNGHPYVLPPLWSNQTGSCVMQTP